MKRCYPTRQRGGGGAYLNIAIVHGLFMSVYYHVDFEPVIGVDLIGISMYADNSYYHVRYKRP